MKTKFTYLLVVITIAIVGTYFLSQKKEASNIESIRKQVASDIKDFKQRGQVGIVRVVPYNGKRTFEDPSPEERIIAVEMVISPRDVTIDPDDLAIHDKNGKFLNYGWPEVYLDDKYRDSTFKQSNNDAIAVLFIVPKNFKEGSLIYSDKKFADVKLTY